MDGDGVIPLRHNHARQIGAVHKIFVNYSRLPHDLADLPQLGVMAGLVSGEEYVVLRHRSLPRRTVQIEVDGAGMVGKKAEIGILETGKECLPS